MECANTAELHHNSRQDEVSRWRHLLVDLEDLNQDYFYKDDRLKHIKKYKHWPIIKDAFIDFKDFI